MGSKLKLPAKSTLKAWSSLSTSNKSCPCVAWTVMIVSSILHKEESLDEDGGGSTTAVGSIYVTTEGSPDGGLDAAPVEDSTLGHLELAFNWAALCLRKVAPIGAMIWTGSNAGKSSKPKSKRILWIKTKKKRPWDFALLLWTSTRELMKREGKLVGASVTRAHKNAHLLMGIVCRCEIGQMEWQEI